MYIESLAAEGFRNFLLLDARFSAGINVITGGNAQGKTNLLEAVYFLSCGRSFRVRSDRDLVNFECSFARLEAQLHTELRDVCLEARLYKGERKQIFINGVKQRAASALAGRLGVVLFCPEDLSIVRGAAAERRKFMDAAICQLRPKYASALAEYGRLYEHKTRILRDWREKPSLLDALDDFSVRMAKMGAELIYYRASWCARLNEEAARQHAAISGTGERLSLTYRTVSSIPEPLGKKPAELYGLLLEHQEKRRQAEIDAGLCLAGAHKDDVEAEINGASAKLYASQGQVRTAALSMKLAEREIAAAELGEPPVLLLDDVLSELDERRRDFVLNRIGGGQVLITCCEDISGRISGRRFAMRGGVITPEAY